MEVEARRLETDESIRLRTEDMNRAVQEREYTVRKEKQRLEQEAVQIQGAQVHLLSGATITARGFIESLRGALNNARP